ncbi:MBL fold metallo-hydrolase [bacterium]|nr:MBL fold metallo-hydrolase [bacterium]
MRPLSKLEDLAAAVPREQKNPLTVSVLVDNNADGKKFVPEHGLSILLEVAGRRILFDTGGGESLGPNARRLRIDLNRLTDVVISHSHYDHTGGIPAVLELNPAIRIFAHPELFNPRYSRGEFAPHRQIGLTELSTKALRRHVANIVWTATPTPITEGVWVTGSIPRLNEFEEPGGAFFLDEKCTRPDRIDGDQAIWVQTPKGIVVILGCAHAGVVNTLERIARLTKASRFHAVIGGMHLVRADAERMQFTTDAFNRFQVEIIAPCHCTGQAACDYFHRHLGDRLVEVQAGLKLSF